MSSAAEEFLHIYAKKLTQNKIIPINLIKPSKDSSEFIFREIVKENSKEVEKLKKLTEISYGFDSTYKSYFLYTLDPVLGTEVVKENLMGAFCTCCFGKKENHTCPCCDNCWKNFVENRSSDPWKSAHKKCRGSGKKCLECGSG